MENVDYLVLFLCFEDDACCADGEECVVLYHALFVVFQYYIVHECSRVAWSVAQDVFELSLFVSRYINDATCDARLYGADADIRHRTG